MRGHVRERGKGNWYAVLSVRDPATNKRKTVWKSLPGVTGKRQAEIECAKIIQEIAGGTFVVNHDTTLAQWIEHWLGKGAPGKRRQAVGARSIVRYSALLRLHVIPTLGNRPLAKLQSVEIDALYAKLAATLTPANARYVHDVLASCLSTATRTGQIGRNPMLNIAVVPARGEVDHGVALEPDELRRLLDGLKGSPLYAIVATAAFSGARRGEILALRWSDFDPIKKTLRIERSVEQIKGTLQIKPPKSARGVRTFKIDDDLVALLAAEYDRQRQWTAGVPDGVDVDLRMIKLPEDALIFPAPPAPSEEISLTKLHKPQSVSEAFARAVARIGFGHVRFHDLRGTCATIMLNNGVAIHTVAARLGHDPAILMRAYAKKTEEADAAAAAAIGKVSRAILGS